MGANECGEALIILTVHAYMPVLPWGCRAFFIYGLLIALIRRRRRWDSLCR